MDPNYVLFRKMDDFFKEHFPDTASMFHDKPALAHQHGCTLIRHSPCNNHRWPVHSWNFNMHQVQLVQPQFAQEATFTFLRICHCPPYMGTENTKCNDFECRLAKHVWSNGQIQPLVSVSDPTYLSRQADLLAVLLPEPPPTSDVQSKPPAIKLLVLVKEPITLARDPITEVSISELENLGQLGRNIVQTILQLTPNNGRPHQPLEFNLSHCHNNLGGFSTLSAHNLLFAALQQFNRAFYNGELRWEFTINLPPSNTGHALNRCTLTLHKHLQPICKLCYKQSQRNNTSCVNALCKRTPPPAAKSSRGNGAKSANRAASPSIPKTTQGSPLATQQPAGSTPWPSVDSSSPSRSRCFAPDHKPSYSKISDQKLLQKRTSGSVPAVTSQPPKSAKLLNEGQPPSCRTCNEPLRCIKCTPVTPANNVSAEASMEVTLDPSSLSKSELETINLRPQAPNTDRATQQDSQTTQTLQSLQTLQSQQPQTSAFALAVNVATLEQHLSDVKGWVQKNEETLETVRHNLSESIATIQGLNDKTDQLTNNTTKLQETVTSKADTKTVNSIKQTMDHHLTRIRTQEQLTGEIKEQQGLNLTSLSERLTSMQIQLDALYKRSKTPVQADIITIGTSSEQTEQVELTDQNNTQHSDNMDTDRPYEAGVTSGPLLNPPFQYYDTEVPNDIFQDEAGTESQTHTLSPSPASEHTTADTSQPRSEELTDTGSVALNGKRSSSRKPKPIN